jgi:hypothetical protein
MNTNPILEEIRVVRDKQAALAQNDVSRFFAILRAETHFICGQGRVLIRTVKPAEAVGTAVREDAP